LQKALVDSLQKNQHTITKSKQQFMGAAQRKSARNRLKMST
jgi:hypothetical protein